MRQRARMFAAALFMVFGLALSPAHSAMMEEGKGMMMDDTMTGMLAGAGDHHAAGTVAITKDNKGTPVLVITDLKVDKVPDGRVYLAKDGDYTKGVELGKLTQFSGKVEFPIPAGTNPADYNGVVIWCKKFSVEIGRASFAKQGMMHDQKGMMK